jgi:uncharacterized protein YecE (DUF72 family)
MGRVRIGSCSWKFDSWEGLLYEHGSQESYLRQYARLYDTVEIDQWFWSLFQAPQPRLPDPQVAAEYAASVGEDFRFTVKAPNSITLTHHYRRRGETGLHPNPLFLSVPLLEEVLGRLEPLHGRVGALIFQFEYLNRQKISSQAEFMQRMTAFLRAAPRELPFALEIRNPAWLNEDYFEFLEREGVAPCLIQGYYMPDIRPILQAFQPRFERQKLLILRLHGPDRQGMEERTQRRWDRLVAPKPEELAQIADLVAGLASREVEVYVNVNNHYEGAAPVTMRTLRTLLAGH